MLIAAIPSGRRTRPYAVCLRGLFEAYIVNKYDATNISAHFQYRSEVKRIERSQSKWVKVAYSIQERIINTNEVNGFEQPPYLPYVRFIS